MDIDIKITDNSKKFLAELGDKIQVALEECGLAAEGFAKKEITKSVYDTPESPSYRRTGMLRNSITHTVEGDSAYVGTDVEYAPYVEMGTSRTRARPFIRPSVINHADEYRKIIEYNLKK